MKIRSTLLPAFLFVFVVAAFFASCSDASKAPSAPASTKSEPVKAPLVHKAEIADWCPEHGVPESVCTRCNGKLVADFQAKGDWCKEHSMPESQCIACHPELEAKLKALAPKPGG
jgi:hypothetical protein